MFPYDQCSDTSSQTRDSPEASPIDTSVVAHRSETTPSIRSRSRNRIPRPRNAFMIFRSEFCAEEKISRSVERDHRHISRIIGYYWNKMPEAEKDIWRRKAEQEKSEHLRKYPSYRFTPTVRSKRPAKRNVKRNGAEDLLRCEILADLLISGKKGDELEDAAKCLGPRVQETQLTECPGLPTQRHLTYWLSEADNVLAYSLSSGHSTAIDSYACSLAFHKNDVVDTFNQDVESPGSPWESQSLLETDCTSVECSRTFHEYSTADFGACYRPAIDRESGFPRVWRQSELNLRRTGGVNSEFYDLTLVNPSASYYTTH